MPALHSTSPVVVQQGSSRDWDKHFANNSGMPRASLQLPHVEHENHDCIQKHYAEVGGLKGVTCGCASRFSMFEMTVMSQGLPDVSS